MFIYILLIKFRWICMKLHCGHVNGEIGEEGESVVRKIAAAPKQKKTFW